MAVKTRNYIGLAASCHDPAIAIVNADGQVLFAEALERSLQNKRAYQCVADNLFYIRELIEEYCDSDADLVVARSWSRDVAASKMPKSELIQYIRNSGHPAQRLNQLLFYAAGNFTFSELAGSNIPMAIDNDFRNHMRQSGPDRQIIDRYYDHHLCHAFYACDASRFSEATCLVVDGYGEGSSTSVFKYLDNLVIPMSPAKTRTQGSLGMFYAYLCATCGFDFMKGEEWKVMGLAPYGAFDQTIYDRLKPSLVLADGTLCDFEYDKMLKFLSQIAWRPGQPYIEMADVAHTGQKFFGEIFMELIDFSFGFHPSNNLVLAGGCALNSAFMGSVVPNSQFSNLYIPPAPADDGTAIGAALLAYQEDNPGYQPEAGIGTPYLGSKLNAKTVKNLKRFGHFSSSRSSEKRVTQQTAELLADGKIIGWIQGRAEFGPRALGNRSILADPRSNTVKDKLNEQVKFRENFRPFCPSILHEHGKEYFENYQESPYMERTLKFRPEVRSKVPGVVHVDGTGRLQTVKKEWNPRYHELLCDFNDLTNTPILLNTSFNVMGRPIAHSVEDVLAVFLTSGVDVLVIDDDIFEKDILL